MALREVLPALVVEASAAAVAGWTHIARAQLQSGAIAAARESVATALALLRERGAPVPRSIELTTTRAELLAAEGHADEAWAILAQARADAGCVASAGRARSRTRSRRGARRTPCARLAARRSGPRAAGQDPCRATARCRCCAGRDLRNRSPRPGAPRVATPMRSNARRSPCVHAWRATLADGQTRGWRRRSRRAADDAADSGVRARPLAARRSLTRGQARRGSFVPPRGLTLNEPTSLTTRDSECQARLRQPLEECLAGRRPARS